MPDEYTPRITVRIADEEYSGLQKLVDAGDFPTISEAIRAAVRDILDKKTRKLNAEFKLRERYGNI